MLPVKFIFDYCVFCLVFWQINYPQDTSEGTWKENGLIKILGTNMYY